MHPYGRHINSNLGYVICSSYITMLFNFVKPNALVKTHILTKLCDICACERFSHQTSSMHAYGQHINSNLGYDTCSPRSNLL